MTNLQQKINSIAKYSKLGLASLATGLILATTGCEEEKYESDNTDIYKEIGGGVWHTYNWSEIHASVKPNCVYDVMVEGIDSTGGDIIAVHGSYNVHSVNGGEAYMTYRTQSGSLTELQSSPALRVISGSTGHISNTNDLYGSTTIAFIISAESTDSEGYSPKNLHLRRVSE